jgi:hypothetical protein
MDIALRALSMVGMVAGLVAWLWIVVLAWKQSPTWGLFALLLPPAGPVWFFVRHTRKAIKPFVLGLVGMAAMIIGIMATQP